MRLMCGWNLVDKKNNEEWTEKQGLKKTLDKMVKEYGVWICG